MADVILENLTKIYDKRVIAVRDLTLHAHDGELLVLVGPSGCGKTTTLRLIAGLEQADDGVVRIAGRNVNRLPPRDRNVTMVFQDFPLYPHMTVHQNMAFGLKMRGVRRAEREDKIRSAAQTLGIADLLDCKPDSLSGGQRQLAALGRAMVLRPRCFLLDEPLSNLDAATRTQLRAQIKSLHRQLGATMIYVTHDQEEAMTLGDRIVVMNHGAIEQIGTPMALYEKPINRFVAGFLGSPRMNFLEGVIERDGLGLIFTDGNELRLPITASKTVVLQFHVGQSVVAGLRPRHLHGASSAHDGHAPVWAWITHKEFVGDLTRVHARTSSGALIVAEIEGAGAGDYPIDQHATFCIDPEQIHFFEASDAGRNLICGRAGV